MNKALLFSVDHKEGRVVIGISEGNIEEYFGVEQIYTKQGITPEAAEELGQLLIKHAQLAKEKESNG